MSEIIKLESVDMKPDYEGNDVIELAEGLLLDTRSSIENKKTMSVPIAELSTLGASVASLVPAFNIVNTTTTLSTDGLFRVANQAAGDILKMAKNGKAWAQ